MMPEHRLHDELQVILVVVPGLVSIVSFLTLIISFFKTDSTMTFALLLFSIVFGLVTVIHFLKMKRIYFTSTDIFIRHSILSKEETIVPSQINSMTLNKRFPLNFISYMDERNKKKTVFFVPSYFSEGVSTFKRQFDRNRR
jgi:hypothetical protein